MSKQLYMVIATGVTPDLTKLVAVAGVREAPLIAKIFCYHNPGFTCIAPPIEGKGFSKLSLEQLQYLFWSQTQTPPSGEFNDLVKTLKIIIAKAPVDQTPLEHLERSVERILPAEGSQSNTGEPKAPRDPSAPPKKGSTTGLVWELAEQVLAQHPQGTDWKIIRAGVMAICEKEDINPATAATQYAKWKAAKSKPAAA